MAELCVQTKPGRFYRNRFSAAGKMKNNENESNPGASFPILTVQHSASAPSNWRFDGGILPDFEEMSKGCSGHGRTPANLSALDKGLDGDAFKIPQRQNRFNE